MVKGEPSGKRAREGDDAVPVVKEDDAVPVVKEDEAPVSSRCWLVLPTGLFLVLFLIYSMVNMHNGIHPVKSPIDLMPNRGAT